MSKKFAKRLAAIMCSVLFIITFSGCDTDKNPVKTGSEATSGTSSVSEASDLEAQVDFENAKEIDLTTLTANDGTVQIEDKNITLTSGGTYILSGTLEGGSLTVDADKEDVWLVLDNAKIHSENSCAINIKDAKNTYLVLKSGSENYLSDTENYSVDESTDPDATLYCKNDLIIGGKGSLEISSAYDKAVHTKDTLTFAESTLKCDSTGASIVAKDGIVIESGNLSLTSGKDALKTTNETDDTLGNIVINGGRINILSLGDGIVSQNALSIFGGEFDIKTGGGAENAETPTGNDFGGPWRDESYSNTDEEDEISLKAIKSAMALSIAGGELSIDSEDDAIHSNDSVSISGGTFEISTGDDGIHADSETEISGGKVNISASYEGIEGTKVVITGGEISVVSADDGINAAGGTDSTIIGYGRPDSFSSGNGRDNTIEISGGTVKVNSSGDGIDSNGSIEIKGGTVFVSSSEGSADSAIDFDAEAVITGGTLFAAGSSSMAESFSESSTQCVAQIFLSSTQAGNKEITLASGGFTLSFTPDKGYNYVCVSSPDMKTGETYSLTAGSTEIESFTQDFAVTSVGNAMGGIMGMQKPGGNMRPPQ
ncbi:MAG: carbohydrate-binding domain-containing protein [Eubacteriales bacterium]|nr:carbohydrate-binding domain-containing protein [Eubacteriales bacterium]